ncbi:ATP-binding protein [Mucilaginibacter lappiensis]|uniref:ATP-binding protein n=1 Tax=Mucilaginibacter lappiensis TaxID=354630 RepID=UPI0037CBD6CE
MTNLINNAITYSPKEKAIEIKRELVGQTAQISVKDEGTGLKPQDKEKVYDRYNRVETKSNTSYLGFWDRPLFKRGNYSWS